MIIQATAWTLFKPREELLPYSFTFWSFDPKDEDSIKDATENIERYVEHYGTGEVLTDFDERVQRFVSKCPLRPLRDVMNLKMDAFNEQKMIFDDIIKKAEKLQGIDVW